LLCGLNALKIAADPQSHIAKPRPQIPQCRRGPVARAD
jgi:hypothetical protein